MLRIVLFTVGLVSVVKTDYDCVCNYAVTKPVYPSPNNHDAPFGYMYEFECKKSVLLTGGSQHYRAIAFEHKLGYVELDEHTEDHICQGDPNPSDILASSTSSTTTASPTASSTSVSTTHSPKEVRLAPLTVPTANDNPVIPTTWPDGTYGLMMAASGCPGGKKVWQTGWRRYDTEDHDAHNFFSHNTQLFLKGTFTSNDIITYFCMKTETSTDPFNINRWPSGTYCILKKGDCPAGFVVGGIHWDDEDSSNKNNAGGAKPDGHYSSNTDIYYCCRNDEVPSRPMLLPAHKAFILLRFEYQCQNVHEMTVQEVSVRWDDEDRFNGDSGSGAHPFDDGGSRDHRLHFCCYTPETPSNTLHTTPERRPGQISVIGYNVSIKGVIPTTWPDGTYGLMMAASGCPGRDDVWQTGWRKYDTEDHDAHNFFSHNTQRFLHGTFTSNDIITYFCMKTETSTDPSNIIRWPSGTYCILKKGDCPAGFVVGGIHWDDEDSSNKNNAGGAKPDGHYSSNTDIYYCCRNDESPSRPMLLPAHKAFILLRFESQCQNVHEMTVQEVSVRWDDEDIFNGDSGSGAHPFDDGGSRDHRLHFCCYTPETPSNMLHTTPERRPGQISVIG